MIINNQEYAEITQQEYRRLKKYDPKNCNSYTARIRFKYFRLIPKEEKFKLDMLQIVARKTAEIINEINKLDTGFKQKE